MSVSTIQFDFMVADVIHIFPTSRHVLRKRIVMILLAYVAYVNLAMTADVIVDFRILLR